MSSIVLPVKKDGVCIICLVQELSYYTLKENNSKIDQVLRDQLSGCHMKYPQFATRYLSYCFLAIPQGVLFDQGFPVS